MAKRNRQEEASQPSPLRRLVFDLDGPLRSGLAIEAGENDFPNSELETFIVRKGGGGARDPIQMSKYLPQVTQVLAMLFETDRIEVTSVTLMPLRIDDEIR